MIAYNNSLFQNGASGDTIYNIPGSQGNNALVVAILNTNVVGGSSVTVDGVAMTNVDGGTLLGNTRYDSFVIFGLAPGNHTITGSIAGGSSGSYLMVYSYSGAASLDNHSYQQIVNSGTSQSTSLTTVAANAVVVTLAAAGSSSAGFTGPTSNLGSLTASHGNIAEVLGGDSGAVGAGTLVTSQVSGATNAVFMIGQIALAPVAPFKISIQDTTTVSDAPVIGNRIQLIAQTSGVVTIPTGSGGDLFSINIPNGYSNLAIVIAISGDNGLTTLSVGGNNLPTALGWFTTFQPTWQYMFWQPGAVSGNITFAGAASGFGNNPSTYFISVYAGVSGIDGHNDSGGTYYGGGASSGFGTSITTTLANDVIWGGGIGNQNTLIGNTNLGNNSMMQTCSPGFPAYVGDSGTQGAPGSVSVGLNWTSGSTQGGIFAIALAPFPSNLLINVADSTAVTATANAGVVNIKAVHASDSTAVTDSVVSLIIHTATFTFQDVAASLVTSGYKWLTSTLLAAQQSFAVRPYFTAQVFDDTIQPNNQFFSGAGNPPSTNPNDGAATAPDGKVFAAGLDNSGNLKVWSSSQLHAVAGVWDNVQTLNTAGDGVINDPRNVFSVRISDWVNGSYEIYVWYFANFANNSTDLTIKCQKSTNGGVSWTELNFVVTNGTLPSNAIGNLSIAGFQPIMGSNGITNTGAFYIKQSGGFYDVYYIYGNTSGYNVDVKWGHNVNSYDWVIHSIASFYLNGKQSLVISGYRAILDAAANSNYSLWVTSLLNNTGVSAADLWALPRSVMPVGAASSTNLNAFTFPSAVVVTANNQTLVYVTCRATLVDSTTTTSTGTSAAVITTHINYMMLASDDGLSFSYPTVIVGTDGSEFNNLTTANIVTQNNYFYFIGGGWLWEYLQANVSADLSGDTIAYQIQDAAGQPSTISIKIANANNKWVGNSPTGVGASAIAPNRKILVQQGYYNAQGNPEVVPRNVYYIDDIQQSVTNTDNSITLVGRDWYKKLKTTISKFTYSFVGPLFFADIFDGTFTSSWNQAVGTWNFLGNVNPPLLELSATPGTILYVGSNGNSFGHLMRIFFRNNVGGGSANVYIYGLYIDANNWLRLDIDTNSGTGWRVTKCVGGSQTDLDSGTMPVSLNSSGSHYYGIYVRRYDFYKFNFMIDFNGDAAGNSIQDYAPSTTSYCFTTGNGEYDLSSTVTSSWGSPFTVGVGSNGTGPKDFRWFFFTQFNLPNNLSSVMKSIARIAGVFSFKFTNTFREYLYAPALSGTYTLKNRILTILAGNIVMATTNSFSDGEITFKAKVAMTNLSTNAGFSFIFRRANDQSNQDDYYKLHIMVAANGLANPPVFARFERFIQNVSNTTFVFYNTPYDVTNNPQTAGRIGIDITKTNTYRVFMVGGWFYAFVNDIMIASWNDNNTSFAYQTQGAWGFQSDANSVLQVSSIAAPDFWKPVQNFSYNPGDDTESSLTSLIQSLRAWMFSDLFGRFKARFLGSSDPSTYTYQNQLSQQNIDSSDKEYVSQVTVYGNGVSATARDTTLMAGAITREMVVVDYTITTQADAQTRANNELTNASQYLSQYTPKQIINVGAELFDAVTVINTGNNSSGVDGPTRTYAQTISSGGGDNNSEFSLELDTGNV